MDLFQHKRHNPDLTGLIPLRINTHTCIYLYGIQLLYCIAHKYWNYCYVTRVFFVIIIIYTYNYSNTVYPRIIMKHFFSIINIISFPRIPFTLTANTCA